MQRRSLLLAAPAILAGAAPADAATDAPVVVELFTSQSCSSCPPADALLVELARHHPAVLALAFHVTYWDRLGWKDPFSLPAATERQRRYAGLLRNPRYGGGQVYTPQAVIQGQDDLVGSDRAGLLRAIASARPASLPMTLQAGPEQVSVSVEAGAGPGMLWLLGVDREHATAVGGGENRGRRLVEAQIVRSIAAPATWTGAAQRYTAARPEGERVAALVQAEDGRILGARIA